VTALETFAAMERELAARYHAAVARAVELADGEQPVPLELVDEIGRLEQRIGVLVTLQLAVEVRR
jgi:hypothetical protein